VACGRLWGGDLRRKFFANFGHYAGPVTLGAVTGPGADMLPWDRSRCHHGEDVRCSGRRGCRVEREAARRWNATAAERWRRMHRAVSQRVRREFGSGSLVLLARVWEFQSRGVLHVHPVLGLKTPRNRRAAERYLQLLAEAAPRYGFGHCERKLDSRPGQRVAAYLSSYFVGGRGRKTDVRVTVTHPDVPSSIAYVSTELTQATGVTMRHLRRRRYLFALIESGRLRLYEGESVDVDTGELSNENPLRAVLASVVLQT
jgi:hypothetical protein